jgi:hypothetical protein
MDQMDQMEQRSVVLFLRFRNLSKKAIHHELVGVLEENVVSYSNVMSVMVFCKDALLCQKSEEASSSSKDDGLDEMNEVILFALSDEPFSSVWQIARMICVPTNIVYRRLVDSLHFTVKHLHCVSHKLADSQKAYRVESS